MKMLLMLVTLLSITACDGGDGAESKKFLNGVEGRGETKLRATNEVDIWVNGNKFETTSSDFSVTREEFNGDEFECSLETRTGMEFSYLISGNQLTLSMGGEKQVLTRQSGSGSQLDGVWSIYEKDDSGGTYTTMTFTKNKMKVDLDCIFE